VHVAWKDHHGSWEQQQDAREIQADLDGVREQNTLLTRQWEETERCLRQEADLVARGSRRQADLDDRRLPTPGANHPATEVQAVYQSFAPESAGRRR